MEKDNKVRAYFAGAVFSVLVGFSFLGVKTCVPLASTLQILTHRYNFAFLAVIIVMLLHIWKIDIKGKPLGMLFLTGAFYVGFMILQTIGLIYATSIVSAIIFAIVPIMVKIIAGIFLKEHSSIGQTIFMFISVAALIAMMLIGAADVSYNWIGITILLLSSLSMAINNVLMRAVRASYTPFEITVVTAFEGFVTFNMATLIWGIAQGTLDQYFAPFAHTEFIIATAYLGIFCILFSAQLMAFMQANMPSVNASIFGNVSTAISFVAGVVVLGEPLHAYHIICTALIIIGVIGVGMAGKKELNKI